MRKKEQWCGIRSAFTRTSEIDSRIIVTTTKHPVARGCSDGGGYVYKMGTLTGDDPRKLFFRGSDRNFPEPSAIPKSCDGLPLALISISENCEGEFDKLEEKSEEAFSKICGPQAADTSLNASGNTPSERMRRILLSSYQDLPNSFVKVSLIYLCMFPPDDDNVRRNSVIRRLLAEGLAQTGDGKAVNNLETLIDHCVTQSTEVSNNGKTKRCKVPGMVLEYIARISQSQGFLTVCDESQTAEPPTDARRLFLHPNSQWKLPEESEPKVRTLAVFSKRDQATTLSNKEAIAKCELLRVLDLEGCGGLDDSDLRNFCNLLLLRYLSLSGSITNVPTEIKKLQVLETLDLRKTKIGMVPVEVIKLPHLKNLLGKFQLAKDGVFSKNVVDFMTNKNTVKKNLVAFLTSQDSKLEMLSGFVTGRSQGFPQLLIHMTKLRKVKIWLDSTADKKNLEYLSGGIVKFLRLTRHDNGRSLSIYIKDCPNILCEDIFLDSLLVKQGGHHPSLYCFKLYGRLKGFPDFLTHLNKITELCLSGTGLKTDQLLSGLNRLPKSSLKYLKLIEQKLGPLKLSKENFTSLVRICLVADKTEDITISDGAMPSNAALYINGAEQKYVALSSLVSLHVLCKSLDGLSGIDIRRFPLLKEVGLHPGLDTINKGLWETAANKHPNWPNLVLIDPPKPKGP